MGRLTELLGNRVYLDTNVVVYAVQGFDPFSNVIKDLLTEMTDHAIVGVTSALTLAEVLVKPKQDHNSQLEQTFKEFLRPSSALEVIPIREDILDAAAELRASARFRLADAIHLATASSEQCTSLLTNDRALKSAPGCRVVILSEL